MTAGKVSEVLQSNQPKQAFAARKSFDGSQLKQAFAARKSFDGSQPKPANRYLRWNLLFTFIIAFVLSSPVWIPLIPWVKQVSMEIVVGFLIIFQLMWLIATVNATKMVLRLRREFMRQDDVEAQYGTEEKIKHLVGITLYKEPLEVLVRTIDSLARQKDAKKKLSVFIGLENGTPEKDEKTKQLNERYEDMFERFIVVIHPKGLAGDLPGKCSNFNYASRKATRILEMDKSYGLFEHQFELIITTGDCDSIFPPKYFECLERDYCNLSPIEKDRTIWQSPLFYCINLHKSPFFVRVTGLLRSFFMMGFLIPWNINSMSIFSLSLKLYEDGGYTHPGYQMDDIIALIRWTLAVRQKCKIRALPVATLSGPTSGASYMGEMYEWGRQIRRWTIGAAEVFHYFAIKSTRLPITVSVLWGAKFVFYYGILLCVAPVYSVVAPFLTTMTLEHQDVLQEGYLIPSQADFNKILLGLLVLQYFWFAVVFLISRLAEKTFPDSIIDETPFVRSVFHWLMSFPTIIGYCMIELWAFIAITFRGKGACQHIASKKDGLVSLHISETTSTLASIVRF